MHRVRLIHSLQVCPREYSVVLPVPGLPDIAPQGIGPVDTEGFRAMYVTHRGDLLQFMRPTGLVDRHAVKGSLLRRYNRPEGPSTPALNHDAQLSSADGWSANSFPFMSVYLSDIWHAYCFLEHSARISDEYQLT